MVPVVIDPEFEALLPALDEVTYQKLDSSIEGDGIREAIVLWRCGNKDIIADGMNRFKICKTHRITPKFTWIKFKERAEVIEWIVNNQLAKRNLTDEQRAYYIGTKYLAQKGSQGGRERFSKGQNDLLEGTTAEKIAAETGVSPKTVQRNAEYAQALDKLEAENPGARAEAMKNGTPKQEVIETAFVKPPKKPKKAPKPGSQLFNFTAHENAMGVVIRAIDEIRKGYPGLTNSIEYQSYDRITKELASSWKKLKKLLLKE